MTPGPGLPDTRTVLTRAAAAGVAGELRLTLDGPAEGIALLTRQVAGTMLARTITLTFDTGAQLDCDATNRQLVRVATGAGVEVTLNTAGPDEVERLSALLHDAFRDAREMTVRTRANGVAQDQPGLSAARLSEIMGLAEDAAAPAPLALVEEVLSGGGDTVVCALRLAPGPATPITGTAEDLRGLAQRAATFFGADRRRKDMLGQRGLLVLAGRRPDDADFVLITHDGATAAALVRSGSGPALARTHAALTA
ncbi:hypothetical protein [Pseudooceanicola sp. LIPI14-2-Ac024]|uniref:hypothetical protein n=1 Tax=Pseudooceanicola sp. LIPI14-2-Ac024 TaxID=3344875 RepID=UPI0035D10323